MLWVVNFLLPQDCIRAWVWNGVEGNALYQQPYSKPAHLALCIILKNQEEFLMLTPKIQSSSKDLFSLLLLYLIAIPSILIRKNPIDPYFLTEITSWEHVILFCLNSAKVYIAFSRHQLLSTPYKYLLLASSFSLILPTLSSQTLQYFFSSFTLLYLLCPHSRLLEFSC